MVTMNQGVKEVRDVGSRFFHRVEVSVVAAYNWVSGPGMTEQDRTHHKVVEAEALQRFPQAPI